MELLGNMGQMEASFCPFGDCVNLDVSLVHDLRQTYHALRNLFGHTWLYTYVIWVKQKLVSVRLERVLQKIGARFAPLNVQ
jgi:hypothetical protein